LLTVPLLMFPVQDDGCVILRRVYDVKGTSKMKAENVRSELKNKFNKIPDRLYDEMNRVMALSRAKVVVKKEEIDALAKKEEKKKKRNKGEEIGDKQKKTTKRRKKDDDEDLMGEEDL